MDREQAMKKYDELESKRGPTIANDRTPHPQSEEKHKSATAEVDGEESGEINPFAQDLCGEGFEIFQDAATEF